MGLFNNECVICNVKAGLTGSKSSIGWVCAKCIQKLNSKKVNFLDYKKIGLEKLKEITGNKKIEIEGDSPMEKLTNLIIENPSISLKKGEKCFYQGSAQAYHEKNVVTGYKGSGAGVSMRVAKGVSVHTGGFGKTAIRETIGEKFDGTLYITNMRIVLLAQKFGFDIAITKITNISTFNNGFNIFEGAKCYSFITYDVNMIVEIINLLNSEYNEQEKKKKQLMNI